MTALLIARPITRPLSSWNLRMDTGIACALTCYCAMYLAFCLG